MVNVRITKASVEESLQVSCHNNTFVVWKCSSKLHITVCFFSDHAILNILRIDYCDEWRVCQNGDISRTIDGAYKLNLSIKILDVHLTKERLSFLFIDPTFLTYYVSDTFKILVAYLEHSFRENPVSEFLFRA